MTVSSYRICIIQLGLLLMALISAVASAAPTGIPEKRIALVIGNSAYRNTPALSNPKNDAIAMGQALKRLGFDAEVRSDLTK